MLDVHDLAGGRPLAERLTLVLLGGAWRNRTALAKSRLAPDRRTELLVRPQLPRRTASHSTAKTELKGALQAGQRWSIAPPHAGQRSRELGLEVLEPALRRAAVEADGGPVAEHLAALLTQPVRGLAHGPTVARYWPRLFGSTPAKVRKSTMRKSPRARAGSVGRQRGS